MDARSFLCIMSFSSLLQSSSTLKVFHCCFKFILMADMAETQLVQEEEQLSHPSQMSHPVEPLSDSQMPATQVEDLVEGLKCSKCLNEVTAETLAAQKCKGQKTVTCKSCHAVTETLRRSLGDFPSEWDIMDPSEQAGFWRHCVALKQSDDSVLRYKAIRAVLSKAISSVVERQKASVVEEEFRPLSYWERMGYCTDDIEAHGEYRQCPVVGAVYSVPVQKKTDAVIMKHVEESIMRSERDCKRKRCPTETPAPKKKAKKGEPQTVEAPVPLTEKQQQLKRDLVDLTDLRSDSEDEDWFLSVSIFFET